MSRIVYQQLERRPVPPSPIQQMKDIAGVPDIPNAEFVAWFKRTFNLFENIRITHGYADCVQQPAAPVVSASGNDPFPAA